MSTVTPKRQRLAEQAVKLRCAGKSALEIAEILGVSRSYAAALYCDPWRTKELARRERYRRPCPGYDGPCGKLMDPSNGRKGPQFCANCSTKQNKVEVRWTRLAIVEAFRDFYTETGRAPTTLDTLTHAAVLQRMSVTRRAEIAAVGVDLPDPNTVAARFGGWRAAVGAAGLPEGPVGGDGHRENRLDERIPALLAETGPLRQTDLMCQLGTSSNGIRKARERLIRNGVVEIVRLKPQGVLWKLPER